MGEMTKEFSQEVERLRRALEEADHVLVGAGAGMSTSAGLTYAGERFDRYFGDFRDIYGFKDMYEGGFYPYETPEESWAFWSRDIYINRYVKAPKPVFEILYELLDGREGELGQPKKDYFILTTNVDHQFQKAGFDKNRIFFTQGDYGLWQCSGPCSKRTYDNKSKVVKMVLSQGFTIAEDGSLLVPEGEEGKADLSLTEKKIPSFLVPYCPICGMPLTMNLRSDDTFVEDESWHESALRYNRFLEGKEKKKTLLLELGVGYNTPSIIKYQFWNLASSWKEATYACLNLGQAVAPEEIQDKSICLNEDILAVLEALK